MQKIFLIFLIIITLFLSGCGAFIETLKEDENIEIEYELFTLIESDNSFWIYRENKTDILYVVYSDYKKGSFTVMFGSDGIPLTYTKWKEMSNKHKNIEND